MANRRMKICLTTLIIREMQIKTTIKIASHLFEWLLSKRQEVRVGKVWKKENPSIILVGMKTGIATIETNMKIPFKS